MSPTQVVSDHDPFSLSFDVGFNEGLEEAHARSLEEVRSAEPDTYIFHDPRVRKFLTYVVLAVVTLSVVLGAALFVEWLQVGRHQAGAAPAPVLTEPLAAEPADGSIGGGLLSMAVGFLAAVGLAGFLGMQVVRPGRS